MTIKDLGDVGGRRVTVSGGTTATMLPDYGHASCGVSDLSADVMYRFTANAAGPVRVRATPINTTDPDGAGALIATISNWCGTAPIPVTRTQSGGPDVVIIPLNGLSL